MNKEQELVFDFQAKKARMQEINDACQRENREMTEAEQKEWNTLERGAKLDILNKQEANVPAHVKRTCLAEADNVLRDARANRYDVKVVLTRSIMTTAGLANTGIIPVEEKEMLEPLRAGIIWDKMGIPVLSGLAGTLRWPSHSKATATWEDETSALVDSSINFSALTMQGKRLGIAIPVSRTELDDSQGIVERVVTQEMPKACADAINAAILTLEAETVVNGVKVDKAVKGPFAMKVEKVDSVDTLKGCQIVTITANYAKIRKELLDMKAAVYGAGVQCKNPGFAMNENTKATLEDTKVDAGSGRFVCEGDMVLGVPVFTSNLIPDGVIMFGDWSYQAAGFFGQTELTIDPYTLARHHSTDFVLNMRFGTATLRPEAFVVGMTSAAQTALINSIKAIGA